MGGVGVREAFIVAVGVTFQQRKRFARTLVVLVTACLLTEGLAFVTGWTVPGTQPSSWWMPLALALPIAGQAQVAVDRRRR